MKSFGGRAQVTVSFVVSTESRRVRIQIFMELDNAT